MSEVQRLIKRYRDLSEQQGIGKALGQAADKLLVYAQAPWKRVSYGNESFDFDQRKFPYAAQSYNATWRNERGIEVPILLDFLQKYRGQRILELGNVARYYGHFSHDIVDKFEQSPEVKNIDILDFQPEQTYDAFVSISTIEHIGWDEPQRDPTKIAKLFERLPKLVKNLDQVLISFPTGYNSDLDRLVAEKRLPFKKLLFLKRIDQANHWQETSAEQALACKYDSKYPAANAVAFGIGLSL